MSEDIITYLDCKTQLIEMFGHCGFERSFYNADDEKCGFFDFPEKKVIAFYLNSKNVLVYQYNWLKAGNIIDDSTYTNNLVEVDDKAHTWTAALLGALFGWFIYSKRSDTYVERVRHTHVYLEIELRGIPVDSTQIDFGSDEETANFIANKIKGLSETYKFSTDINVEIVKNAVAEEYGDFVTAIYDSYPMDFWICLPREYFNKVRRDDVVCIPKDEYEAAMAIYETQKERNELLSKTVSLNNEGSQYEKEGNLDKAIELYEENISLGYDATFSYDRLLVIYRKLKRQDDELRICKAAIEKFPSEDKYQKRLNSITLDKSNIILPTQALVYTTNRYLGEEYFTELKKLSEFDFYHEGYNNSEYYKQYTESNNLVPIRKIINHFKQLQDTAENAESTGNLQTASVIYEQMIAEKCYFYKPYDRLIKIYSKAKLKEDEIRVTNFAIDTLGEYKKKQLEYIRNLASKYGATEFAEGYIGSGKSISYFAVGGGFTIYDPYNIIETWNKRLNK